MEEHRSDGTTHCVMDSTMVVRSGYLAYQPRVDRPPLAMCFKNFTFDPFTGSCIYKKVATSASDPWNQCSHGTLKDLAVIVESDAHNAFLQDWTDGPLLVGNNAAPKFSGLPPDSKPFFQLNPSGPWSQAKEDGLSIICKRGT